MTPGPTWVPTDITVAEAARCLADADVGAVPICDSEGHLRGMVTDRDMVVGVIAAGLDPHATRVEEIIDNGEVVTIGANDSMEEAIRTMKAHGVRRLPVIDGHELVGMVSQADIARCAPDARIGDLVEAISEAPSNTG